MLNNRTKSGEVSNSLRGCCRAIARDLAHGAAAVSIGRPVVTLARLATAANTHVGRMS
jgi:hypothetical protein